MNVHMKVRSVYPVIVVPLVSIIVVGALLVVYLSPFTRAAPAVPRATLANAASAYTSTSRLVSSAPGNQRISLALGLKLRNQSELSSYLQQVSSPSSPLYRRYLNPASFAAMFGPLPQSETAVVDYLRSQGLTITATYPNHLLIDATGTIAQVEQAFQVKINNYRPASGGIFFANAASPTLPVTIAGLVGSVSGLDNTIRYQRHPLVTSLHASLSGQSASTVACPQPGSDAVPTSYTPAQITSAYDFGRLYNAGILGDGQTVGLLELDGFSPGDIAAYTSCFGGSHTVIKTIPIDGFNGKPGVNASEVELDMEMVLGLVPHLSSLRVYEAANALPSYNDAWARIVSDAVPVVSTSWVFCEQGAGLSSEIQQENIFFQEAAAQGQTILAASGDQGANGCYNPQTGANPQPAVDDPASQPFVTGVGGTTLRLNFDSSYQSEQVWNDRTINDGASGGGVSQVWQMPAWQQAPGVANAFSDGYREVPDISMNADPQTGYDVYCTVGGCAPPSSNHGWMVFGGTSAAAPVWAAMIALANESSLKVNGFMVGFLNPSLYDIAHDASGTSYAQAFHDIVPVQGGVNNNDYVGTGNTYPTASDYDLATGLGSFDAYNLAQNLNLLGQGVANTNVPTSTTWYFAEGYVGGGFQEYLTLMNPDPIQTAQVQVRYLFQGSTGPAITHDVSPQSRFTVNPNADLHISQNSKPGRAISMVVTSVNGVGIVAERPMYFTWRGISSGTDTLGTTQLGQDYYFADVEAQRNYSSFITILNPPGGKTANVTLTYIANGAQLGTQTVVVPPGQRATTWPQAIHINQQSALAVHSDQPVVVERPMYFTTSRSNISGAVTGAATVVGAPAPTTDWLFAEGYTGTNFHEYLVLANFDATVTANVTVKLEYSNGAVNPTTVQVPPLSQYIFDVNAASASFAQSTTELSAEITSDAPVVAQRQEYFRFNGNIPGGTDVIGAPGPAKTIYSFAEGYAATGFNEFLTLQNPNATGESVAVTLYLAHSIIAQQVVTVGPMTRVTVNINSLVVPIAQSNPAAGYEVSMSVWTSSGTIMAERPMYFNYHNVAWGGTDVAGFTG
jgi:Pro-kumamolisin, activation domain/Subtilase family